MKYFKDIFCIEDLKKQYKKLAFENHPDHGGNAETMKEINVEYDTLFEKFKNIHRDPNGECYESKTATAETPEMFKHIIETLIGFAGIAVELCGRWIWVSGATFEIKDTLKDLGFRFSGSKKAWYWRDEEDACRKRTGKSLSLEEIRERFGSENFAYKTNQNVLAC